MITEAVDNAEDAAFVVGPNGHVSAWNAAAEELFGVPRHVALWAPCHQVVGLDVCRPDCPMLADALTGHSPPAVDCELEGRPLRLHHLGFSEKRGNPQVLHIACGRRART